MSVQTIEVIDALIRVAGALHDAETRNPHIEMDEYLAVVTATLANDPDDLKDEVIRQLGI